MNQQQAIYAMLAIGTGVCLAVQSAANGKFREHLGSPLWAAFFSICGTIICATIAMIVLRPPVPSADALKSTSWWFWIGGPMGALIVLAGAALTPRDGDARRLGQKRWRAYAETWDAVLSDAAFGAHVRRRILELDDPRLGAEHAAEVLSDAEARVCERLLPFLAARIQDGEAAPLWVHESRTAERAAQTLIEARTRDVEAALEQAAKNRGDAKLAPSTWRQEGRVMVDGANAVALLAVAKERADALGERVAGALINLGVDANAIGAYDDAVVITEKALLLAHNPEHLRLCEGNVAIYRNNRAQKLAPPGR